MEILIDNTEVKILYWDEYSSLSVESQRCALNDISEDEYFVCEYFDCPTLSEEA